MILGSYDTGFLIFVSTLLSETKPHVTSPQRVICRKEVSHWCTIVKDTGLDIRRFYLFVRSSEKSTWNFPLTLTKDVTSFRDARLEEQR